MHVGVIGINHKLAKLSLRESVAKACSKNLISSLHQHHQFILLSTCNRTEIYFSSNNLADTHTYLLNILRNAIKENFEHKLYSYFGLNCFSHLAKVTAGLDSAIIGETEIQGQVKKAYEKAASLSPLTADLHFIFQKSLFIGKYLRSHYQLRQGMPCLEHAILSSGFFSFENPYLAKLLFVGASEINHKILSFFYKKKFSHITICNRSFEKLQKFINCYHVNTLSWKQLSSWHQYDWIIFGTSCPNYLLKRQDIPEVIPHKLIIDLSVPRNVDPSIKNHPKITLQNIDQINQNLKNREKQLKYILPDLNQKVSEFTQKHFNLFKEKQEKKQAFLIAS